MVLLEGLLKTAAVGRRLLSVHNSWVRTWYEQGGKAFVLGHVKTQAGGSFMFMQELKQKSAQVEQASWGDALSHGMWSLPVASQQPFLGGSMPSALSWSVSPSTCLALPLPLSPSACPTSPILLDLGPPHLLQCLPRYSPQQNSHGAG